MTTTGRIYDLSLLWKQAAAIFPCFDLHPLDWDAAYRDYLPKVLSAGDGQDFHLLLAEFLSLLGDGHTDYSLPASLLEQTGFLPFSLFYAGGSYYIRKIASGGEPFLLARVEAVNDQPLEALLNEVFRYCYHVGPYAYPSRLETLLPLFLNPAGNILATSKGPYPFDLTPARPPLTELPSPSASRPFRPVASEKLDIRLYEGNILYVRLDDFQTGGAAAEVREALKTSPSGVILDLRENIGGMTKYGADIAELFLSGQFHACQKRTRLLVGVEVASATQFARMSEARITQLIADGLCDREEAGQAQKINAGTYYREYTDTFGAPGHRALFDGPCVLLTSRNTISAAEDFTAMFRTNRRAALLGAPTCGTTGTPFLVRLTCGGRARICSVGCRLLDGTEFTGTGIQPDILLEPDLPALEQGRDAVLDAALGRF